MDKTYKITFDMIKRVVRYTRGESADKVLERIKREHKRDKIKARNYKIELD